MSKDLANRRRKVDLEKMDGEQAESIGLEVGKKIGKIIDNANKLTNEILSIYGLRAKINYVLVDKNGDPIDEQNTQLMSSRE